MEAVTWIVSLTGPHIWWLLTIQWLFHATLETIRIIKQWYAKD
jgi:hypothetical protein